jgi:type I restriction enzyme S subunit
MGLTLKPYTDYTDVSARWLVRVPAHWQIIRTKHMFRLCTEKAPAKHGLDLLSIYTHIGVRPRKDLEERGNKASSTDEYWIVKRGDIIVNKLLAWMGAVGVSHYEGVTSPAYDILRKTRPLNPDFYHYLFRTGMGLREFKSRSRGIMDMRLRLYFDQFGQIPLVYPPLAEQDAIVAFLDHFNRLVNRLILAKRRLIKLLNEQKQVIIHRAVTRGLDPNVRLKASGIEWLGDVPEHWEVRRIRNVTEMQVSNVDKHKKEGELHVRLCNYVDVYKNERITERLTFMRATATAEEIGRFRLQTDDVLITKDSEIWKDIGVPALVEYTADDLVCGYHLALLRSRNTLLIGPYLLRALQSQGVMYQFHVAAKGVTRYGLSHDAIKSVFLPVPSLPEQTAIVRYLDEATANLVDAIEGAGREIDRLNEYRNRLIADVVTGKLDVRDVELPPLEEAHEPDDLDLDEDEADDRDEVMEASDE